MRIESLPQFRCVSLTRTDLGKLLRIAAESSRESFGQRDYALAKLIIPKLIIHGSARWPKRRIFSPISKVPLAGASRKIDRSIGIQAGFFTRASGQRSKEGNREERR